MTCEGITFSGVSDIANSYQISAFARLKFWTKSGNVLENMLKISFRSGAIHFGARIRLSTPEAVVPVKNSYSNLLKSCGKTPFTKCKP